MHGQRVTRAPEGVSSRASEDLFELGELARTPSVKRALAAVRDFLGMDLAFVTELVEDRQVFRALVGNGGSFGFHEGLELSLDQTYCQRVLSGRLPNLIPDVRLDQRAASLRITEDADVGAFASVPLTFSDGRSYGTLCAASHAPKPALEYRDLQALHVFARVVADELEREELACRVQALEDTAHGLELQAAAAVGLLAAVRARDAYTRDHSWAVVDRAAAVARELGLGEAGVTDVKQVALLHDVGKIAVPHAILTKPGPLSADEWTMMRRHPLCSESMVWDLPDLRYLAPMVRAEHERWDGGGYPDGLEGQAIPLDSRIVFVCDAYHAMTSDRPYRPAQDPSVARAEIEANIGTQFCPTAAHALLSTLAGEE